MPLGTGKSSGIFSFIRNRAMKASIVALCIVNFAWDCTHPSFHCPSNQIEKQGNTCVKTYAHFENVVTNTKTPNFVFYSSYFFFYFFPGLVYVL